MNTRRYGWGVLLFASLSALYGVADAQTATPPPAGDTSVGMQRQAQLSPQEQLAQADAALQRMSVTAASVRRMLETARAQRDVVKTLCLNDKLNQIDVAARSAQDRRGALDQAVQRRDSELASHEFTILQVIKQRVEQLNAEANQCIGEEAGFIGESRVTTTIDPGLPGQETTNYPEPPPVISQPPQCASCIK
jgi:hypothetical protein